MKRSTLILSILLVVSVSINLGIAGVMLGHRLRHDPPRMINDRVAQLLPETVRRDMHERMRANIDTVRERVQILRNVRREVNEALRARPFDAARAEMALAALRLEIGRGQSDLHAVIIDRMKAAQDAGTLPPPPEKAKGKGEKDRRDDKDGPPSPPRD